MYKFKCVNCGWIGHSSSPTLTPCENCGGEVVLCNWDHPVFTGDLHGDLKILSKLVYEASQLHNGIYISVARCAEFDRASATARVDGDFIDDEFDPNAHAEINPCPFCGSVTAPRLLTASEIDSRYRDDDDEQYTVCCRAKYDGCGASSGYSEYKDAAVAKWNRRGNK